MNNDPDLCSLDAAALHLPYIITPSKDHPMTDTALTPEVQAPITPYTHPRATPLSCALYWIRRETSRLTALQKTDHAVLRQPHANFYGEISARMSDAAYRSLQLSVLHAMRDVLLGRAPSHRLIKPYPSKYVQSIGYHPMVERLVRGYVNGIVAAAGSTAPLLPAVEALKFYPAKL